MSRDRIKSLFLLLVLGFLLLVVSHLSAQNTSPTHLLPIASEKEYQENGSRYFPAGTISTPKDTSSDPFGNSLAWQLRSIGEPPLSTSSGNSEIYAYRLILLTFPAGRTFVLRLQIAKDHTGELFVKETDPGGTVLLEKRVRVSDAQTDQFLGFVEKSDFWKLPTREEADERIYDGSYWFIEAAGQGKYHMVYRRAPDAGPFTDIGRCLVKDLAQLPNSVIRLQDEGRPELMK